MQLEMEDVLQSLHAGMEQLHNRAAAIEETSARMGIQSGDVEKITAAVEINAEATMREMELEHRLAKAEEAIASLQAESSSVETKEATRKTLPGATVQLLAKQGLDAEDGVEMQSLDAALRGLSIEQRIAVKSQMLRSGVAIS